MAEMSQSADLVKRQEAFLNKHPLLFRFKLILYLLLGLLLFGGLILASVVILALCVVLAFTGKAWIILLKFSKLVIVLLIPLWAFLRIGWRALTSRQPMPEGRKLKLEEAPRLFAALEEMRRKMNGPKIDNVFLVPDLNAFAITRPTTGFWFVPWRQHYIALGVPLIQSLSEQEAMAIVAHEYGHLSGHPSRFDAFVYRLRFRLIELWQSAGAWQDWPSRLLMRLLNWYIPLLDRWAFTLCRASEYAADDASCKLIGKEAAASALMRVWVADAYLGRNFWGHIYSQAKEHPDPTTIRPWLQLPTHVRTQYNENFSSDMLRSALLEATGIYDTHPALSDRLSAIQFDFTPYRREGRGVMPVAEKTAAESWFGEKLPEILHDFNQQWSQNVAEWWEKEHASQQQKRKRFDELRTRDESTFTVDEQWEFLMLRINFGEIDDPEEMVRAFMNKYPDHAGSMMAWGREHIEDDFKKALRYIYRAMRKDRDLALEGARFLFAFFEHRSPPHAVVYSKMIERLEGRK